MTDDRFAVSESLDPYAVARAQQRVAMLRAVYEKAVENAEACAIELWDAERPSSDGQQQYRNLLAAEHLARRAYVEALVDLTALDETG